MRCLRTTLVPSGLGKRAAAGGGVARLHTRLARAGAVCRRDENRELVTLVHRCTVAVRAVPKLLFCSNRGPIYNKRTALL